MKRATNQELLELVQEIQQLQPNSPKRKKLSSELIKKIQGFKIIVHPPTINILSQEAKLDPSNRIQVPGILLPLEKLLDKDLQSLAGKAKKSDKKPTPIRYLVPQRWMQEELYADAQTNTLLWIRDNIDKYDPNRGTVKTWVNQTLCWKFLSAFNKEYRSQKNWGKGYTISLDKPQEDDDFNFFELPVSEPCEEEETYRLILELIKEDPEDFLKNIVIRSKNGKQISLQELLLMRLEDKPFKEISAESGISIKTLSSSINRHKGQIKNYITKYTGIEFDE